MLYSPPCGKRCPLYPRVCYVNHPEKKIYATVKIDYANLALVKEFFYVCEACDKHIPVNNLPEEIQKIVPVLRDKDYDD